MKRINREEQAIQKAIIDWSELYRIPLIGPTYGHKLREYLIHVPNGGQRSKVEAAILKAMGVSADFPDLVVFHPAPRPGPGCSYGGFEVQREWHGAILEVKRPGEEPTDGQERVLSRLRFVGYFCNWFDNVEDGIRLFKTYFGDTR